jgi:hypothetical protein
MELIDPFPGRYDAADPFGNSKAPRTYPHTGSDWIVGAGSDIPAIGAGVIVNKQWHSGNGNTVTVKLDGDSRYYAYLHLKEPITLDVGARVELGQTGWAKSGATGTNARGAHLHVTISDSPDAYVGLGNRVDPYAYIHDHADPTTTAGTGTPINQEDENMPVTIYKATSTAGFIFAGWRFIQGPDGTLRAFSPFEWDAYNETHPGVKVAERTGAQLYDLSKRVGLYEFTGTQATGPRALTGRIIGRSADLNNEDGSEARHFGRGEAGAWPAKIR